MTESETAMKRLKELQDSDDIEMAHKEADDILVELLIDIGGYTDVVLEYEKIKKWYA